MHLATVSDHIQCYDWPNSNIVKIYSPDTKPTQIRSASWANTARWMCIVTGKGEIEIISFRDPNVKFLHQIKDLDDANYATFHSLNKRDLAIARKDTVLIYDMKRSIVKRELGPSPDNSEFFKLAFDSHDMFLYAAARDNHVYVYDQQKISTILHASNTGSVVNFVANDQFGMKIAACTDSGACILWELEGITNIYSEVSKCAIRDLAYRENSLMYVTENGQCIIRDFHNTSTISRINLPCIPKCIDMCTDGIGFAICDEKGTLYAYDVRNLNRVLNKIPSIDGEKIIQISFCKKEPLYDGVESHADTNKVKELQLVHECNSFIDTDTISNSSLHINIVSFEKAAPRNVNNQIDMDHININKIYPRDTNGMVQCNKDSESTSCLSTAPPLLCSNSDIIEMVRDAVKTEMDLINKELKRLVHKAVIDATKSNFYELRMALVKEFVKVQEILDRLQKFNTHIKNEVEK